MSLGLESGTVRVVSYDSASPRLFHVEAERLRRLFERKNLPIVIEHTGSTAAVRIEGDGRPMAVVS